MRFLLVLLVYTFYFDLFAQEIERRPPERFTRERNYDVLHYLLNLEFNEIEKTCSAEVAISFVPLRPLLNEVVFDAGELNIQQVRLKENSLAYSYIGESLRIDLGQPYSLKDTLKLTISYTVSSPQKGLYFIAPDSGYPEKPWQIWSQGQPEDNHFWFPCYDYPNDFATSEMIATVNEKFKVISNGKLVNIKRNPKQKTVTYHWHESKPHPSYLISIVVGDYIEVKDDWQNLPVSYFVYPNQKNDAIKTFSKTPKALEFFSSKIGYIYPWEKYAQVIVADFIYGGMENVSASTLHDGAVLDDRAFLYTSSDGLIAHELAHQWWGNLLTCRNWSHAWLSEGFATYFEILFREFDKGRDEAALRIWETHQSITVSDVGVWRRPTVCNRYWTAEELFDNRIYGKGAAVLHMLRFFLGDELFWEVIKKYVKTYAFQNVETSDFKRIIDDVTGYNLHWFFDQWLYKAGYPEFEISSQWQQESHTVQLRVRQVQEQDSMTGIFITPIDIEVWVNYIPETYRIHITKADETFSFPAYQPPQTIIFDKGNWILKRARYQKSLDEWIFQLNYAKEGIDRLMALYQLQFQVDSQKVYDAIRKALFDDPFWEVRRLAAQSLGYARDSKVVQDLFTAYGDRDARVRSAAINALGNFQGEDVIKKLFYAFNNDRSYQVVASALTSLARIDPVNARIYATAGLRRDSHEEIIRLSALRILSEIGDDSSRKVLMDYTKYGVNRSIREEAIRLICSRWLERDEVVSLLIGLLNDRSWHIRLLAIEQLKYFSFREALEPLQQRLTVEVDRRLQKSIREAIKIIQQKGH